MVASGGPTLASASTGSIHMAVITALGGNAPAQAAKAATTQIPIVFVSGGDPVSGGLVASFNRPGGNVTGVVWNATVLVPKRLELLRGLAGNPGVIGALVNPGYPDHDLQLRELKEAAATIRQEIIIAHAATAHDIDTAFASLVQKGAGALIVANDPFFFGLRDQIVAGSATSVAVLLRERADRASRHRRVHRIVSGSVEPWFVVTGAVVRLA